MQILPENICLIEPSRPSSRVISLGEPYCCLVAGAKYLSHYSIASGVLGLGFVYCACHMTWPLEPIMFHWRQNSLSRRSASEGKIAMEDILPPEGNIYKSANCVASHGWAGLKKNKCSRSTGSYGLDAADYGRSGLKNLGPYHLYFAHLPLVLSDRNSTGVGVDSGRNLNNISQ